jgi:hypothetical protein
MTAFLNRILEDLNRYLQLTLGGDRFIRPVLLRSAISVDFDELTTKDI